MNLQQKHILIGVSSSIAAYRALDLASMLRKAGADVRAVLSPNVLHLVGAAAFDAICGTRTITTLWGSESAGDMDHLAATKWAHAFVIVPATGNVLGKLAHGIADDALTTFALAWNKPLLIAPAMNPAMWANVAVQENVKTLRARGHHFIGPVTGDMACRDFGEGRLAPVDDIFRALETHLAGSARLAGKRVLITSGPTREFADDVRCITNPSTGRMGIALAEAALAEGAEVTLVSGPCDLPMPAGTEVVRIQTAEEMLKEVLVHLPNCDAAIFAAAVSDWRPKDRLSGKLKKSAAEQEMTLELERTPDIAAEANKARQPGQTFFGFAAECENLESYAGEKMQRKGFQLVFANPINRAGAGFGSETNEGLLLWSDGRKEQVSSSSKFEIARRIISEIK